MPQTPERKREYMREYMRRKHGFRPRGVGKREFLEGNLVPLEIGDFSPLGRVRHNYARYDNETGEYLGEAWGWVTKHSLAGLVQISRKQLLAYMDYIGGIGYTVVDEGPGYQLRPSRMAQRMDNVEKANIQLQADLARIELMMDSMLREEERL